MKDRPSSYNAMLDRITVHGARQHNLKNIDVEIPRNSLTVITGLSGSGKSSLAFDTIYAEGQRRYVETLSTYARQFLDQMERPDVDSIDGLSPAISIEQKTTSRSPRSTVGTITEIYDYLRVLYASIGVPHCPVCGNEISRQTTEADSQARDGAAGRTTASWCWRRWCAGARANTRKRWRSWRARASCRARIDGVLRSLDEDDSLWTGGRTTPSKWSWTACWSSRHRKAAGSVHRNGYQAGRRPGADCGGERRGAAVFAETGVHRVRREHPPTGAAFVFLQQPLWRLRSVPWPGQHVGVRPRRRSSRTLPKPLPEGLGPAAGSAHMEHRLEEAGEAEPHQPVKPVRGSSEESAGLAAGGGDGPGNWTRPTGARRKPIASGWKSTCPRRNARPATACACGRPAWRCG